MKVAALISGEPRFCEEFDLFLERLTGYDQIDWYFYLWRENFEHPFYKFDLIAPKWRTVEYAWAINKIQSNLPNNHKIAKLVLADQKEFNNPEIHNNLAYQANVYNVWKMYQSIKESDLLRRDQNYDLVIRTRPDVMLEQKIDLSNIADQLKSNTKRIIVPNNHWHGSPAINDWVAISTPENMKIYSSVVDYINTYCKNNVKFHPETLLAHHLKKNDLEVVKGSFSVGLRKLGTTTPGVSYHSKFGRWE